MPHSPDGCIFFDPETRQCRRPQRLSAPQPMAVFASLKAQNALTYEEDSTLELDTLDNIAKIPSGATVTHWSYYPYLDECTVTDKTGILKRFLVCDGFMSLTHARGVNHKQQPFLTTGDVVDQMARVLVTPTSDHSTYS